VLCNGVRIGVPLWRFVEAHPLSLSSTCPMMFVDFKWCLRQFSSIPKSILGKRRRVVDGEVDYKDTELPPKRRFVKVDETGRS
jgi:hypothetical protein